MARKTNKTAHVLDLISKAKETNHTDEMDEDLSINTIEEDITSDLTFVGSQMATDTQLSDQIMETLEQEVELKEEAQKETHEIKKEQEEPEEPEEPEEVKQEEYKIQTPKREFHVGPLPDLDAEEIVLPVEQGAGKTTPSTGSVLEDLEKTYCYINVLEQIVRERAVGYMKRFGVCHCSRCTADIIALTLNGLPPKYVVTNQNDISPLMNYFSNYYAGSVITQLSRACLIVKANPQH